MKIAKQGPRAVKLRSEFLTNLILVELVAGLIFAGAILFEPAPALDRELRAHGREVWGTLLPQQTERDHGKYRIPYEYRVAGRTYSGQEEANVERFQAVRVNGSVRVWYLPNHPEISATAETVDASERRTIQRTLLFVAAALLGMITLVNRARARRERSILRDWLAVSAKVTAVETELHLEVPYPEGADALQVRLRGSAVPNVGQEMMLLRNPEAPDQVRLVEDLKFVEARRGD